MDAMQIKTPFMRAIISKMLSGMIKNKTGYTIDVSVRDFEVSFDGDVGKAHITTDVFMDKHELAELMREFVN